MLYNPLLSYESLGEQGLRGHVSLALEPTPRAEVRAPGEAPLVVEPPAE